LSAARTEIGPREARWILEAAGIDREGFQGMGGDSTDDQAELTVDVVGAAMEMAERRAGGEPLQYVTGTAAFRHLRLRVGPGVLIPRPETELVAERAIELLPVGGVAIDVGTGSGAIALAIADERRDARVLATDDSEPALEWARANVEELGLDVTLVRGELFGPLTLDLKADVVVSNPPYVGETDAHLLAAEVRAHEPHHALFAGAEGLDVIRRLAAQTRYRLRPGGHIVLEIGYDQRDRVERLLVDLGYTSVQVRPDLAGRDRIASATHDGR
jgi:release factor glutamine methyltransferase